MRRLTEDDKKRLSPEDQEWLLKVFREEEERESRPVPLSLCPFCKEMKPERLDDNYACGDCIRKAKNHLGQALEIGNYEYEGCLVIKNLVTGQRMQEPESLDYNEVYIEKHVGHVHAIRSGGVAVVFVR